VTEDLLLDLVGRIYDAAAAPELWPVFLERMAEEVGGGPTQILLYDVGHQRGNLTATVRLDPWHKSRYDQYYGGLDCWGAHGRHLMTTGNVVTGQMLCPDATLGASEFYNDFLRPIDAFHQFCGFILKEETAVSLVSTLRPQRAGAFGEEAVQLLRLLMPHLQRAMQIHQKIAGLRVQANASSDALDCLPFGFLTIDQNGKILLLNRRAQDILSLNDGLSVTREGLTTCRWEETSRLRALLQTVISRRPGKGLHSGGIMVISRPSLRRAFQVLVTPLPQSGAWLWPSQSVAGVFLADPEHQPVPPERVLAETFGLSLAEARLAASLMQGKSLEEAAAKFHLSRNTLRSQLRSVFAKTSTRRQGELVRLLVDSVAQLQCPPNDSSI
jgi:DNA-binding CsgD family transcriptional regulator/PAS domain-containing protein